MLYKRIITNIILLLFVFPLCQSHAAIWPLGKGKWYEEVSYETPKIYKECYYIPSGITINTDVKYTVQTIASYTEYGISNNANFILDLKHDNITTNALWSIKLPQSYPEKGNIKFKTHTFYGYTKLAKMWSKKPGRITSIVFLAKIPIITAEEIVYDTAGLGIGFGYIKTLPYSSYIEATSDLYAYPKITKLGSFSELKAGIDLSPFSFCVGAFYDYNDTIYQETKVINAIGNAVFDYYRPLQTAGEFHIKNYRLYNELSIYAKISYNFIKNYNIYLQFLRKRFTNPSAIEDGVRFGIWKKF